jgi:hypothetical protein
MDAATAMFAGGGASSTALAASGPLGGFGAASASGGGLMLAGEGMSLAGGAGAASFAIPGIGWAHGRPHGGAEPDQAGCSPGRRRR